MATFNATQIAALDNAYTSGGSAAFYALLASYGDAYGTFGYNITTNNGWDAQLVNGFAQSAAERNNVDLSYGSTAWAAINNQLAAAYKIYIDNNGSSPDGTTVQAIHNQVYTDNHIDINGWLPNQLLNDSSDPNGLWTDYINTDYINNTDTASLWADALDVLQAGVPVEALANPMYESQANTNFTNDFLSALLNLDTPAFLSMGDAFSGSSFGYILDKIYDLGTAYATAYNNGLHLLNGLRGGLPLWAGSFFDAKKPPMSPQFGTYGNGGYDPLVLDLTGNGIQTTTLDNGTFFDNQNTGFSQQSAWIAAGSGNGILVNDPSGGAITNGSQEFGSSTSLSGGGYAVDGFAALADLDSNHDNVINSSDSAWSNLRIWVDANGNGVTDTGEIETLSAAGVASISLSTTNVNTTDANGNVISKTATFNKTGGGTGTVGDVTLKNNTAVTIPGTTVTVDGTISLLPDLSGYGTVYDLQQAAQIQKNAGSTLLQTYVQSFVSATDDAMRNTLADEIIYQWAGVASVSPTARGTNFDARQLEALEKLSGTPFNDPYNSTANPDAQSVPALMVAYQQLHNWVLYSLEIQTNLAGLFADIQPTFNSSSGTYDWNFSSAQAQILQDITANRAVGLAELADFNQALHVEGMDTGANYRSFRSSLILQGADVTATFINAGVSNVNGTVGDNVIEAWQDGQVVYAGYGGNNTLIASGNNEILYGSGGSNLFIGGSGNNVNMYGGNRRYLDSTLAGDTFIAGTGTETFHEGVDGFGTFVYGAGNGNLTIQTWLSQDQTLMLKGSINESNFFLSETDNWLGNMTITDGVAGDTITLLGHDVGTLVFADGRSLNLTYLGSYQHATSGATLSGTTWANWSGGLAADDAYFYDAHNGTITLNDAGGTNVLFMGTGITAGNMSYSVSGNDLLITDGISGDQIRDVNRGVQTVVFADGTTNNLFIEGNTYTLASGSTSTGIAFDDTYSYSVGTGTASISDPGGSNTIALGTGVTSANLVFTGSGNDLLITDGHSGDTINVLGQLGSTQVIRTIRFSNGTTMSAVGVPLVEKSGNSLLNGTSGSDTLTGNSGDQTLTGFAGNDTYKNGNGNTTVFASAGNDTYSFASGSGHLTINDIGGLNTIVFGTGITAGNVTLTASGNDLLITDGIAGDQIDIIGELKPQFVVQSMVFSGGTTQSLMGVNLVAGSGQTILNGTAGGDTLHASNGNETLIGNGGDDTLIGATGTYLLDGSNYASNNTFISGIGSTSARGGYGNDTYSYAAHDGQMTIYDNGGQNNIYLASGILSSNVSYGTTSGGDLVILDGTWGDQITIQNQLTGASSIQSLIFADGSTRALNGLTLTQTPGSYYMYGSAGNDRLIGATGMQTLIGNGGNDTYVASGGHTTIIGGTGNDVYSFGAGSGALTIQDYVGNNTLVLDSSINKANVSLIASGQDLLITDGIAGDLVTLKTQLGYSIGVGQILFSDSTTLALENLALTATPGFSSLNGTAGNDTLSASAGTQIIWGNGGNDTFIAGSGITTLYGFQGNDLYSFASGSGRVQIYDQGGTDTLKLGTGLTSANVSFSETSDGNDLLILDSATSDLIDIVQQTSQSPYATANRIETLVYGDGSSLNLKNGLKITAMAGNSTLIGTEGNDTLYNVAGGTDYLAGNYGNDTYIISNGTTTINAYSGNDLYSYSSGSGYLTITDQGGTDTLKLGIGLTAANVSFSASTNGANLIILDGVAGDQINLAGYVSGSIEKLIYGDGSTLDLTAGLKINAMAGDAYLYGTSGSDTLIGNNGTQYLYGNGGNDTFIAGIGNTTIIGSYAYGGYLGNDLYSYNSGSGRLTINAQGGTDTLKLGTGLTAANTTFAKDSTGLDLLITDGVSGDQIDIYDFFSAFPVSKLIYGDGSTLNLSTLSLGAGAAITTFSGTSGNDTLTGGTSGTQMMYGNGGNDVFIVGKGATTISGNSGNDVYSFASGKGHVLINEQGGTDTLKLGTGLTSANVILSESGNGNDLLITDGVSGDQIDFYNAMNPGYLSSYGLEKIIYGDNTTLTLSSGMKLSAPAGNATLNGTTSDDTLTGGNGTQTLRGNGGNDSFIIGAGATTANGGTGNDIYSYASGKGLLTIVDNGGTDTLKLGTGLTAANASLSESSSGYDLIIKDGTTGDQIVIQSATGSGTTSQIEKLIYGDGSILDLTGGLKLAAQPGNANLNGTTGNDTLIGGNGTQYLSGKGGNDIYIIGTGNTTIYGGSGNDLYSYTSGKGILRISDNMGTDTLKLGTGMTSANVTFSETYNGNDYLITDGVSGDQIIIQGATQPGSLGTIEKLIYGDGTTLTLANGLKLTAQQGNATLFGTTAADTLTGGNGTQSLYGYGGNDLFIIGAGNTSINAGTGNDVFTYLAGKGLATIFDQGGTDTLKLGTGLTSANVSLSESNDGRDLVIMDGTSGDKITLQQATLSLGSYSAVETLIYGDGTTLNLTTALKLQSAAGNATLNGTAGNDTLTGNNGTQVLKGNGGNDVFYIGIGNTTANGNTGNDLYSYVAGDGLLTISDSNGIDTLKLGTGLTSANISLSESASGYDLWIMDGITGDRIAIANAGSSPSYKIEKLIYGDGSTLDLTTNLKLIAQSGSASLNGTAGDDTLIGTIGSQILTGNGGNDVFIIGQGVTSANGGSGNDLYSYVSGSGSFKMFDNGGTDTLKLGAGLTSANVSLSESSDGYDLFIVDGTTGDKIDIVDNFYSTTYQIEKLIYGDNTTLNLTSGLKLTAQAGNATLNGTVGNDTLLGGNGTQQLKGNGGNDIFIVGSGITTINGGNGDDLYSFDAGKGQLTIYDQGGTDTLKLGTGLTASNVTLGESSNGYDLIITDGTAGDLITLQSAMHNSTSRIEKLIYGDGTTLDLTGGLKLFAPSGTATLAGTASADTLTGGNGTQTINGNGGSDLFVIGTGSTSATGGTGNDTYTYLSGHGKVTIYDQGGTDTLKLGTGLTSSNVTLSETADGYGLLLTDTTGGDQIIISGAAMYSYNQIEKLIYGDGTTLDLTAGLKVTAQMGNATLNGSAGSDTLTGGNGTTQVLRGNGGNDIFIIGQGVTSATGGSGNDLYSFTSGKGLLTIYDQGGTDTLKLGTGLTSSNVTLSETSNGQDLLITDGVAGDLIDISYWSSNGLEKIIYGDGTMLSLTGGVKLTAQAGNAYLVGSAGGDTLTGGNGTQTLSGNGGNDLYIVGAGNTSVNGGNGNDTYSFASGKGRLTIYDGGGTDTLKLGTGLTSANVSLSRNSGYDLIIKGNVAGDQIMVQNFFNSPSYVLETLIYGDGSTANLATLSLAAGSAPTTFTGTSGNDTLTGTTGTQVMLGNGGNDLFITGSGLTSAYGGSGNDIYSYASGKGQLFIQESGGTDTLKLGTGLTSSNVSLSESSDGRDLLITDGVTGDQINVMYNFQSSSYRLEQLVYGDGSTLDLTGGLKLSAQTGSATLNGSTGNDTLTGNNGTHMISGNGGNDIFIIGTGLTSVYGGSGNDLYSYVAGDGRLIVNDYGGTDTLKLGAGLTSANVSLSEDSTGTNLLISDGTSGDLINFANMMSSSSYQIEKLIYGDGSTLDLTGGLKLTAQAGTASLNGTTGNDTLIGGNGAQLLNGKGGNDTYIIGTGNSTVYGGSGNDLYSYASGKGYLTIQYDSSGTDTLKLGTGMTSANVSFSESINGSDLLIMDGIAGDLIDLASWQSYKIETLVYGDGSTLDLTNGLKLTAAVGNAYLYGTSYNDTLTGTSGTQILYGYGGNDLFIAGTGITSATGGSGNDTYSFTSGKGSFIINDQGGTDTLKLGTGLISTNIVFSETGAGHDLLITDSVTGDQINITSQFSGGGIETLIFGDNSTLDLRNGLKINALAGNMTANGTAGNDTLTGTSGTQYLYGNGGNDLFIIGQGVTSVTGGSGNDLYSYASGKGSLAITDYGGTDTIKLATGLTASNTWIGVDTTNNNLLITDNVAGDQIVLNSATYPTYKIETLIYGDGTTLNLGTNLLASYGSTSVIGTTGNEVFVAGTYNTTFNGGGGTDTYDFGRFEGQVVINNGIPANNAAAGTLNFGHAIADTQLWLDRVDDNGVISSTGNNLRIDIMGSNSSVTVNNWYSGAAFTQLTALQLSDSGLKLDAQLNNLVQAMATFESSYQTAHGTAFDPTAVANSTITDTAVLTAVNADWHS